MSGAQPSEFALTRAADGGSAVTDRALLQRFVSRQDEAAFAELLARHGAMVRGMCQRVLANPDDADDAFQATFMVLARKAAKVSWQESIAGWLYQTAHRIALKARTSLLRRRAHENEAANMPRAQAISDGAATAGWRELRPVLDDELNRLPEKYRLPLVLCYLENKTNDQAADLLGWTRGTVAGRLSRARDLLRQRLARRGVVLPAALLATLLTTNSASAVPTTLLLTTAKAATLVEFV